MNRINCMLVTDDPIEFEKRLVEVEDFMKITPSFERNLENIPQINKRKPKDVTRNQLDLETLRSQSIMPKIPTYQPIHPSISSSILFGAPLRIQVDLPMGRWAHLWGMHMLTSHGLPSYFSRC